jgi:hypothetical protein
MRRGLDKERTMTQKHKLQNVPIVLAAALAFLAIGAVENAKARPLAGDGGGYGGYHHHRHKHYGRYGYYHYGYHPYKYYPRPYSSYRRFQ